MRKLSLLISVYCFLLLSQGAFADQKPQADTPKVETSVSELRPLLAMMKLDLQAFEMGLAEGDETYWCEPQVNNGPTYTQAMTDDFRQLKIQTDITTDDIQDFSQAFTTLYDLCGMLDAQDSVGATKYIEAFELLVQMRDLVIDQWP